MKISNFLNINRKNYNESYQLSKLLMLVHLYAISTLITHAMYALTTSCKGEYNERFILVLKPCVTDTKFRIVVYVCRLPIDL